MNEPQVLLPEYPEDDAALCRQAKENIAKAKKATDEWRTEARECFDFDAGHQWAKDDIDKLREQMRPVVQFNRVHPVIETVAGLEIANRQEIRYIPRQAGAAQVNEMLTGAAAWIRDECNAEDEESEAFRDMLICGIGCTETRLDYEGDPDGQILIERTDILEMYWDPATRKQNLLDAAWLARVTDVHRDWIEATWPDKAGMASLEDLWQGGEVEGLETHTHPESPQDAYTEPTRDKLRKDGLIRLVEYQWIEYETHYKIADPDTGQVQEFDARDFDVILRRSEELGLGLDFVAHKHPVRKRAFLSGEVVFEIGRTPCPHAFTYQFVTGYRDRNNGTFYGLVRSMRDPQRWANKWLAQTMHIINSNAKGGVLAEQNAFVNTRKAEEDWAKPDAIIEVKPGGLDKIRDRAQGQFPAGTDKLMNFAIQSIPDVTGVNAEVLGLVNRDQSAMLEFQRKQTAVTILSTLFDSLRRYRKQHGRMLLYLIQEYLSDDRLIRISGQKGQEYVRLARDDLTARYDVIIDDAPTSPNEKQRVWELLVQVLPILPTIGLPLIPELLDYLPVPASLVETWKAALEPKPPSPEQQMMQQLQQRMLMAAVAEQESAAMESQADAQKKMLEAGELQQIVMLSKAIKDFADAKKSITEIGQDGNAPAKAAEAYTRMAQAMKAFAEAEAVPSRQAKEAPFLAKAAKDMAGAQSELQQPQAEMARTQSEHRRGMMKTEAEAETNRLKAFGEMAVRMREAEQKPATPPRDPGGSAP